MENECGSCNQSDYLRGLGGFRFLPFRDSYMMLMSYSFSQIDGEPIFLLYEMFSSKPIVIVHEDRSENESSPPKGHPHMIRQIMTPPSQVLRGHRLAIIPLSHLEAEYSISVHISRVFLWVFLLCHVLGCLWFVILEYNETTNLHVKWDDVGSPKNFNGVGEMRDGADYNLGWWYEGGATFSSCIQYISG